MRDGNPVVWLWLLLALAVLTLSTTNLVILALLSASSIVMGRIIAGPRQPAFTLALGAALAALAVWGMATVIAPATSGGATLLRLPVWQAGPGLRFGGALTADGLTEGLIGALRAVVVLLLCGIAGQVTSARRWLGLSWLLGPLSPAVGPVCCLGEGAVEGVAMRSPLAGTLVAARNLARMTVTPRTALALARHDLPPLLAGAALTAALLATPWLDPTQALSLRTILPEVPLTFAFASLTGAVAAMGAVSLSKAGAHA